MGLFYIRRIDRILNAHVRGLCGMRKGMDGLMKHFSSSLDILKEWRIVGLLNVYMRESVWEVVQRIEKETGGLI